MVILLFISYLLTTIKKTNLILLFVDYRWNSCLFLERGGLRISGLRPVDFCFHGGVRDKNEIVGVRANALNYWRTTKGALLSSGGLGWGSAVLFCVYRCTAE